MAIGWGSCWFMLPEYSMSMSDRLAAFWCVNRIGFGGITLMTITALLAGVISHLIGGSKFDWNRKK